MSLGPPLGILLACIIIVVAMIMGGGVGMFINLPSVLIVIGGTLAVTAARFSIRDVVGAISSSFLTVKGTSCVKDKVELIDMIAEILQITRKNGILYLQKHEVDNKQLQAAIKNISDGRPVDDTIAYLKLEQDLFIERHTRSASVFDSIGDSAPAFGMIGTLIGLIQMLANMSDPSTIGPAMSVAMLTTLYGAMIATMIAIPLADKIKSWQRSEIEVQNLIIDGVEAIYKGVSPIVARDILKGHLHESQRKKIEVGE